ncbi:MAG: DUF899 family protein, partial [Caulobacteraceae bacterium]
AETRTQLQEKRKQIETLQTEMRGIQAEVEPEAVRDYVLTGWDGPVRLSELFAGKRDLIVIHNMGRGCPACTMWADGFNGVYDHLASRAAFVVTSPDPVETQKAFAASRGWRFPMASHAGTSFAEDMGYRKPDRGPKEDGGWWPGVSVFRLRDGRVVRVSDTGLGPGDNFCVVHNLLDLAPGADLNWMPKYRYA